MKSFTPLSTIKAISDKIKNIGITSKYSSRKNPLDGKVIFSFHYSMPSSEDGEPIQGFAEEPTKKMAQQRACQEFLVKVFPPETSWKQMIEIVQNDKDLLISIFRGPGSQSDNLNIDQKMEEDRNLVSH